MKLLLFAISAFIALALCGCATALLDRGYDESALQASKNPELAKCRFMAIDEKNDTSKEMKYDCVLAEAALSNNTKLCDYAPTFTIYGTYGTKFYSIDSCNKDIWRCEHVFRAVARSGQIHEIDAKRRDIYDSCGNDLMFYLLTYGTEDDAKALRDSRAGLNYSDS